MILDAGKLTNYAAAPWGCCYERAGGKIGMNKPNLGNGESSLAAASAVCAQQANNASSAGPHCGELRPPFSAITQAPAQVQTYSRPAPGESRQASHSPLPARRFPAPVPPAAPPPPKNLIFTILWAIAMIYRWQIGLWAVEVIYRFPSRNIINATLVGTNTTVSYLQRNGWLAVRRRQSSPVFRPPQSTSTKHVKYFGGGGGLPWLAPVVTGLEALGHTVSWAVRTCSPQTAGGKPQPLFLVQAGIWVSTIAAFPVFFPCAPETDWVYHHLVQIKPRTITRPTSASCFHF